MSEPSKATITIHISNGDDIKYPLEDVNYLLLPCECGRMKKVRLAMEDQDLPSTSALPKETPRTDSDDQEGTQVDKAQPR